MGAVPLRHIPVNLLEVTNLKVHFPVGSGLIPRTRGCVKAVDGVSFAIAPGETLGLVGESGCGKTTTGRAVTRLLHPTGGKILFDQEDITSLNGPKLRARRRHFQMVFQDPRSSLNPRMTVREILGEALDAHNLASTPQLRNARIEELLVNVGLEPSHADRLPAEFSGGQRQRIGLSRALALNPKLIVFDEPVSALDVSVQAQIINLLQDLQVQRGLAYLFIGHDMTVVEHLSHRIMVMYLGKIVETAEAKTLVNNPKHPYTQALISAVPVVDPDMKRQRIVLPGDPPSSVNPPAGCPFHPRCPIAVPRCETEVPPLREIVTGHQAACHLAR
jgi:oligopeptide/dipeptide ABC transporter ATP-binding protein